MALNRSWTNAEISILKKYAGRGIERVLEELGKRGFERPVEGVTRKLRRLKLQEKWAKDIKVGYLDIESTGLTAPWGHLLTWCIKEKGKNKIEYDIIKRSDIVNYKGDKKIIGSLVKALSKYDHIITYYGGMKVRRFDLPMIFSKALRYGIKFPKYGELTNMDLYDVAKSKLRLHNYRLATVCEYLGIKGKTPIDTDAWRKGALGHPASLKKILVHNKYDVVILEKADEKLRDYHANTRANI